MQSLTALPVVRGGGSILLEEDFNDPFGNGWTVADNQNGGLWIWVPGNSGNGQYIDGSGTGSTHPGGEYSVNAGTIESSTSGNGWMNFFEWPSRKGRFGKSKPCIGPVRSL